MAANEFKHQEISKAIIESIKTAIKNNSDLEFSQDAESFEKDIIEYNSRWRILALDKFNGPVYTAVTNFFRNKADQENNESIGALVIFFDEENIVRLLNALGKRGFTEEDQEIIIDHINEFSHECANYFTKNIATAGFPNLQMSATTTRYGDISEGVNFDWDEHKYSEVHFHLFKEKCIISTCTLRCP